MITSRLAQPSRSALISITKRSLTNGLYHHQLTLMDRNEKMRYMKQSYAPNHRVVSQPATKTYRLKGTPKIEDALFMIKGHAQQQHAA